MLCVIVLFFAWACGYVGGEWIALGSQRWSPLTMLRFGPALLVFWLNRLLSLGRYTGLRLEQTLGVVGISFV